MPFDGACSAWQARKLARTKAAMAERHRKIMAAREDPAAFIEYCGRLDTGDYSVVMEDAHREWQGLWSDHDGVVVLAPVGTGKALPVETPIAVPGGWKAIGELVVGDLVIGGDGKPTEVTYVSPTWDDHEVYEFDFDDGTSLRSDADHQWSAWTVNDRGEGRAPRTVTTRQIIEKFTRTNGQKYWSIPLTPAVEHPHRDLPIHPYVLGVWLGDGTSGNSAITCHRDDAETVDRCIALEDGRCGPRRNEARLYKGRPSNCFTQTVGGITSKKECKNPRNLRGRLNRLGVLNNKHIPAAYLTASIEQRRELLAGLLDTDGTVDKRTGRIEFCNTNKAIAQAALVLARSLGYKATLNEGRATLYGVDKGPVYKIGWTTTEPCFQLARKAAVQAAWVERRKAQSAALVGTRANRFQRNCWDNKVISAWRKVETVPVRCIAVAAEHHTYVATDQYIVTHNTTQLRYRLIFEMGKDPNVAIAYLSATQSHPRKQLRAIKDEIETNHRIHQVFPRLKKAQGEIEVWNQTEILIDREGSRPDVTVQCFGLYGNILGSRKNILVFDDICNYLNTLTEASREKMHEWVNEALSRLKGKVKVWAIGHIWHERDLLQRLAEQPGFAYARYEATTPDPANPDGPHILNFPRVLPQREINRLLDQINSPVFQEMMLWNRLPDRTASRFRDLWFETCLRRGSGYSMVPTWDAARSHTRVVCGVDLGHRKKIGSDLTVMITAAVYADGSRRLLDMRAGNWTGSEIMENLEDVHDRFGAHIWVEDNGAQNLLLELGEKYTAVPLYAHNTNRYNKGDLANGVEAVGRQMKQGKWVFPCNEALIDAIVPGAMTVPRMREILGEDDLASRHLLRLIMDCKSYDPEKHTGDYLMAFWILSEGIRKMAAGEVTPVGDFMAR